MITHGISSLRRMLRKSLARRLQLPEIPVALERLARQGFNPKLVFDVGAYRGDFARVCRTVWPTARIVCFEPQKAILPELRQYALETPQTEVFEYLLGAQENSQATLNEAATASSVLLEKDGPIHPKATYEMRTIQSFIESETNRAPDFLKLDVQGYELEVLKGTSAYLDGIQVILAELNLLDIHEGVPLIEEVVGWLAERGWAAFDILWSNSAPIGRRAWQADFLFVPVSSVLRRDKRWASN